MANEDKQNNKVKKIYWAGPERYEIANFRPEKRDGGRVVTAEQSLVIRGHTYETDDPEAQKFIESSRGFGIDVLPVKSLAEARNLTAQRSLSKRVVSMVSTDETIEKPEVVAG